MDKVTERLSAAFHGDFARWQAALDRLPVMAVDAITYGDTIEIRGQTDAVALEAALRELHPWRKGPFRIGDVFIDSEWRSDWKWARLEDAIDLAGKRVLDIGCGNGYFGWRMLEAGASEVVGIDPTILFCMQHRAIQNYVGSAPNHVLPLGIEDIPDAPQFDCVLSMGVIYHRRDPAAHIEKIHALTAAGGTAVVESLVNDDVGDLIPNDRYARMRNVWCIPTVQRLVDWMEAAGFADVGIVDVTPTTIHEQRTTDWMTFESLAEALDSANPSRTVEGHPAPVRAIVIGRKAG